MSDQSESARFQVLLETSLREYEKQTDITLDKHPLYEKLQHCDSVESINAIIQEQVRVYGESSGYTTTKSLNSAVSILRTLSASIDLGPVRPKVLMRSSLSLMLIL